MLKEQTRPSRGANPTNVIMIIAGLICALAGGMLLSYKAAGGNFVSTLKSARFAMSIAAPVTGLPRGAKVVDVWMPYLVGSNSMYRARAGFPPISRRPIRRANRAIILVISMSGASSSQSVAM